MNIKNSDLSSNGMQTPKETAFKALDDIFYLIQRVGHKQQFVVRELTDWLWIKGFRNIKTKTKRIGNKLEGLKYIKIYENTLVTVPNSDIDIIEVNKFELGCITEEQKEIQTGQTSNNIFNLDWYFINKWN